MCLQTLPKEISFFEGTDIVAGTGNILRARGETSKPGTGLFYHNVETGYELHPVSYLKGNGLLPGGKLVWTLI
jgi:hypothetical protein